MTCEIKCGKRLSKRLLAAVVAAMLLLLLSATPASAITVFFSLDDDPADAIFGRTHVPGTVTGILHGLVDDATGQLPTAIEITSDVSFLAMTDNMIDGDNGLDFFDPTGLDIAGGVVTGGGFGVNFTDPNPAIILNQIRFNSGGYNLLHYNGGTQPNVGTGNQDGFAGATYRVDDGATVPEPAAAILAVLGMGGLMMRRRRNA